MDDSSIDWQMSIFKRFWFVGLLYLVFLLACLGSGEWYIILTILSIGLLLIVVIITDYYFFKYKREKKSILKEEQKREYRKKATQESEMIETTNSNQLITIESIENIARYFGYYLQKEGEVRYLKSNNHSIILYDAHKMTLKTNIIYNNGDIDYFVALQVAAEVMESVIMVKINVVRLSDNPLKIGITISVETLVHYANELKINFSQYLDRMHDAEVLFEYEIFAKMQQLHNEEISQPSTQKDAIIN